MRTAGPHVLVVDDNADELRLMIAMLRAAQCRITIAYDGSQGYKRAVAVHPDIILMDVRMPTADGFAACRLLKSDPATRDIPLIFLSACHTLDERLAGLQSGAVDFIMKPFEPAEVLARIRIHLKKSTILTPPEETPHVRWDADHILVNAAVTYLANSLANPPELKELARKVGTYEKRLSRAFKEVRGKTVFEFVRDERLRVARHLLLDTFLSVTDIADELGFSSAANFATAFRKEHGVTPSAFLESSSSAHVEPSHVPRLQAI